MFQPSRTVFRSLPAFLFLAPTPLVAQCELQEISASDGSVLALFGESMDVRGGFSVVGARRAGASMQGQAYFYRDTGSGWVQDDVVTLPAGEALDDFGTSVSLHAGGLTLPEALVGAPRSDAAVPEAGAVYVFRRQLNFFPLPPSWEIEAVLSASDASADERFGQAVDRDGDVAVVGATFADPGGTATGAVYVFRKVSGAWQEEAILTPPDGADGDLFGSAVDVEGNLLLVGAPNHDHQGLNAGAAYGYSFDGTSWNLEDEFHAPDAAVGDGFGSSVALEPSIPGAAGNFALVGAPFDDSPAGAGAGSAHVFRRQFNLFPFPPSWEPVAALAASDAEGSDNFGYSVDFQDERLVVGARLADAGGMARGAAYLFQLEAGLWIEHLKLVAGDGADSDWLGSSAVLDGELLLLGAPLAEGAASLSGVAYLFSLDPADCPASCDAPLLPTAAQLGGDRHGAAVAIHADRILAGAPGAGGEARIYRRFGDCWSEEVALSALAGDPVGGAAVDISATHAIVGDPADSTFGAGAGRVYIFERTGSTWALQNSIAPAVPGDVVGFGHSVAIDHPYAFVGEFHRPDQPGRVFVYRQLLNDWFPWQTLQASDAFDGDFFGSDVAIDGSLALVGAQAGDFSTVLTSQPGAAYAFRQDGGGLWVEEAVLSPPDGLLFQFFGHSVDLSGDTAVVGAPTHGLAPPQQFAGRAYAFRRTAFPVVSWSHEATFQAPSPADAEVFGDAVAVDGDRALVGAPHDGPGAAGSAHLFERSGTSWSPAQTFLPFSTAGDRDFGEGIALGSGWAVVGDDRAAFDPDPGDVFAFDLAALPATLAADTHHLPYAAGGEQNLLLQAGPEHAGKIFWVLGSVSGTSPGTPLLNAEIPLVQDFYFDFTLAHPQLSLLDHPLGLLDFPGGVDEATLALGPAGPPVLQGLEFHHAYFVLGAGAIDFVSEAVPLLIE